MSGYLGVFDTCMIEFVQIWVSLLLILVCLCFCFLERMWCCLFGLDLGILLALVLGFLCVCFSREILGLLLIELVTGLWVYFFGLFMVWFGFFGFDKD